MLCRFQYFCTLLITLPVIVKLSEKDKVTVSPSAAVKALLNCEAAHFITSGNLENTRDLGDCAKLAAEVRQSNKASKDLSDFMALVLSEILDTLHQTQYEIA
jgi:hypothetical protein